MSIPEQISDHFDIRELVHPHIYNHPAVGIRCVDFIHPATPATLEAVRKATNCGITINDWLWKGVEKAKYTNSGLRLPSGHVGAVLSSHRFGCGFDLKFNGMTAQEAHAFIIVNQNLFPNITRMEAIAKTPSWVHIEIGAIRSGNIVVFNP